MAIRTIPLSRLEADPKGTLVGCADSGSTLVVELPDRRLVAIRSLESPADDDLIDELIATDPAFRTMAARSRAGPRKPFPLGAGG